MFLIGASPLALPADQARGPNLPAQHARQNLGPGHFRLSAAEKATPGLGSPGALVLPPHSPLRGTGEGGGWFYVYRVRESED